MVKGKYIRTKEIRKKMSISHNGKKHSEETKNKIANKHKGKSFSKEHRNNLSNSLKNRHINPKTEFKKGQKAWNYKGGKKLKRKMKKYNGILILNAHYVWLKHTGLNKIPKRYIIHHKDGNSLNDNIENLELMKDKEHKEYHNFLTAQSRAGPKLK